MQVRRADPSSKEDKMSSQSQLERLFSQSPQYSLEDYYTNHHLRYKQSPETEAQHLMAVQDYNMGIEHLEIGEFYLQEGKTEDAMRMIDQSIVHSTRAINLMPIFTEAYQNLASAYFIKGNYHKVIEVCRQI